ncbi:thiamine pyrophosphate-dependent enzyme [Arsenophonus sp.]|uniref:thiamine pyrophosphate-dependent enzyme n=1 Tax=Arsenophonus sp. TaxID=1872640 RepID=UPI00387A53E0
MLIELLLAKKSLFWLGFGARYAGSNIQKIIQLTNSAVMLNSDPLDCDIPVTDFALFGRALGADGYQANNSRQLEDAIVEAIKNRNPAVIDVRIDKNAVPPLKDRNETIKGFIND